MDCLLVPDGPNITDMVISPDETVVCVSRASGNVEFYGVRSTYITLTACIRRCDLLDENYNIILINK